MKNLVFHSGVDSTGYPQIRILFVLMSMQQKLQACIRRQCEFLNVAILLEQNRTPLHLNASQFFMLFPETIYQVAIIFSITPAVH